MYYINTNSKSVNYKNYTVYYKNFPGASAKFQEISSISWSHSFSRIFPVFPGVPGVVDTLTRLLPCLSCHILVRGEPCLHLGGIPHEMPK